VSLSVPFVWLSAARNQSILATLGAVVNLLALAAGSITDPSAATRVDISGGQHAEQGRATAGTAGPHATADPGNGPGPLKPIIHRCDFLGFRLIHRTLPPRGETRPKQQVYAPPFPWARRNPNPPRHGRPGISDCDDPRFSGHLYPRIKSRRNKSFGQIASRLHAQPDDQNDRGQPLHNCHTESLCHRITRHSTFTRDIFETRAKPRPQTGSYSRRNLVTCPSNFGHDASKTLAVRSPSVHKNPVKFLFIPS